MAEEKKELSKNAQKIMELVEGLNILELNDLVKALEERFGVSASAPVMMGMSTAGNGQNGANAEPEEVKTEFDVVLADAGANKINVIKVVREIVPSLGLVDAKKLVESTPKSVLEGVKKDAAEEAKKKLEAAGAKVELK